MRFPTALLALLGTCGVAYAQLSTGGGIEGQSPGTPSVGSGSGLFNQATPFQVPPGTALLTLNNRLSNSVTVLDYGAKCDGTTDDSGAITAALAANVRVLVPAANCFIGSGITVPAGHSLIGIAFSAGNPPNSNSIVSQITCPHTIVCVTLGSAGVGDTVVLKSLAIVGQSGTPSGGSEGVHFNGGQNVILEDVVVYNFDYGYHLQETNTCVVGLGAELTRVFSGSIRVAHLWFDSWAEARVSQSRFGMNGVGDIAGADYIRISGGCQNTAGGPNTLAFSNSQFNQGAAQAGTFLNLFSLGTGGTGPIDTGGYSFTDVHVENMTGGIVTDATWNILRRMYFSNFGFNAGGTPFFSLNAATGVGEIQIVNSAIYSSTFNLSGAMGPVRLLSSYLSGTVNLASTNSADDVSLIGNLFSGSSFTLSGAWANLWLSGNYYNPLVVTFALTPTGNVQILDPQVGRTGLVNQPSVGLGFQALQHITTGQFDVGLGANSLSSVTTGGGNVGVGYLSLGSVITTSSNTAIGHGSLDTTTGTGNTALGFLSGSSITTGQVNTVIGTNVGSATLTTGSRNILLGTASNCDTATGSTNDTFLLCASGGATPLIQGFLASGSLAMTLNGTVTIPSGFVLSGFGSPASGAACTAGQLIFDTSFLYFCTASGAWKRAALTGGF